MKISFPKIISISLVVFALIVFFLALNIEKRYSTEKIVGKSVDDFEIKFLNNDEVFKKQDLTNDKYHLINIWASWCLPCRNEHPILMTLKKENKLKIIGINFKDKKLQPYITQFYGTNKKGGQNRGGYAPQFSASISHGKLYAAGAYVIDENNLKGKWHKVEFNVRYSKKDDGFFKVYINGELKVNRTGFQTSKHSHVEIKYGSYSHPEYGGANYPEGYQFPSHTIYFAGFSIEKDRNKLLTSK